MKSYIIHIGPRTSVESDLVYTYEENAAIFVRESARVRIPTLFDAPLPTEGEMSVKGSDGAIIRVLKETLDRVFPNLAVLREHDPTRLEYDVPVSSCTLAAVMEAKVTIPLVLVPDLLAFCEYALHLDYGANLLAAVEHAVQDRFGNVGAGGAPSFEHSMSGRDLVTFFERLEATLLPEPVAERLWKLFPELMRGRCTDALLHGPILFDLPPRTRSELAAVTVWESLPRACVDRIQGRPIALQSVRMPNSTTMHNGALHIRLRGIEKMPEGAMVRLEALPASDTSGRLFSVDITRISASVWSVGVSFEPRAKAAMPVWIETNGAVQTLNNGESRFVIGLGTHRRLDGKLVGSLWMVEDNLVQTNFDDRLALMM